MAVSASEAGRALSAARPVKAITCLVCGTVVEGRGRRQYCSPTHAYHAAYLRKKARLQAKKGESDATA